MVVTGNAMTTVTKNKWTFFGRIIFVLPLIWLLFKPIQNSLHRQMDWLHIGLLIFFLILVVVLGLFMAIGLLFKPVYVTADNETKTIQIKTIAFGVKTISYADINGYSATKLLTRFKNYSGIILYLQDGSKIELTEFNLESLDSFKKLLRTQMIKYYGDEKSCFPFRPITYRYDNNT